MKYFLRLAIAPIVYFLSIAFITIGLQSFPTLTYAIKTILNCLCLGLYIFCAFVVMKKEGEMAFGKLLTNDISRRKLLETGQDVEINTLEEYRAWKGFIAGAICLVPLFILIILHLIIGKSGESSTMSVFAHMFYSPIYAFFGHYKDSTTTSLYYGLIINCVFLPLSTGIPYIIGAMRRNKQRKDIEETNRKIHG